MCKYSLGFPWQILIFVYTIYTIPKQPEWDGSRQHLIETEELLRLRAKELSQIGGKITERIQSMEREIGTLQRRLRRTEIEKASTFMRVRGMIARNRTWLYRSLGAQSRLISIIVAELWLRLRLKQMLARSHVAVFY